MDVSMVFKCFLKNHNYNSRTFYGNKMISMYYCVEQNFKQNVISKKI